MRVTICITIILLNLQCSAVASKRKHGRKRNDRNSLQTVKYQEHRDVSLLYGASKDLEDSAGQPMVNDYDGSGKTLNTDIKKTRKTRKHHLKGVMRFPNGNVVADEHVDEKNVSWIKQETIHNDSVIQDQDRGEEPPLKVHNLNPTKSKTKFLPIKRRGQEMYRAIKKHKIPRKNRRHRHKTSRKRTKVEEDPLSEERQNIAKALNSIDDIQGSYNRGLDMDGMDINQVTMIDNSTLSDYFHALNDGNTSERNNYASMYTTSPTQPPTATESRDWDDSSPSNTEGSSGTDDFYDAIDRGDEPPPLKMNKVRPTKSHFIKKLMNKSGKDFSSTSTNPGSTSSSKFRLPSKEDFENFFRGMLDHFGNGRSQDQDQQSENDVNQHEKLANQRNMTAFLDSHDRHRHGNVTKLVSLGSPEVKPYFARQQDTTPPPFKGTRIMGGKISGGQISGGLIQGGQIKAGSIEGGIIKGGQITGGRITNGTMDGGLISKGQMSGGHLVDGRIEGGQLLGGNVFGGRILGGSVEGGNIKGGVMSGGRFRGGSMQGGVFNGGEIQSGILKGGKVEGGILHGGNIEGGVFRFGDISGGTLKSGSMLGGQLKNGSIEGGTLKGGTIEGGVLKGGVMEGGHLKGGLVLAGKIKGGIIEGGVIEGGEIGDGVVIRNGKVNATIIGTGSSIDKSQRLGGLFKQGENSQQLGLKVDQQKYHLQNGMAVHGSKMLSDSPTIRPQAPPPRTPELNHGLKTMNPNFNIKVPLREGTLKMLPHEHDSTDDDNLEKLLNEGMSTNENSPELSSERFFEEQGQANHVVQKKGSNQHHVVFDGVGFDIPNADFVDLIGKMKQGPGDIEDLVNYYTQPNTKEHLKIGHISDPSTFSTSSEEVNEHIKPEELEMKLSNPTKPRSSVTRFNKYKHQHNGTEGVSTSKSSDAKIWKMKAMSFNTKDVDKLRPTYHWSLNKLIKDRIPGSPGPAIRTHGQMKAIRGGLHLNGHNSWLGVGDFSGGCISDPDTCDDGLSFEMTFRLDKDALKYNDMNYIVDSGASTFNSKGFTLYTVHGNLRADLAIANQEFCLQIPVTVQRWQDVLVTWKKSEGMKMYVNCELKAQSKGSEHCIGCHSHGCHVTDTNTLLMIGRPNYSPHFHCTKFDSGDIAFWEKYLSANDVETLCGAPTGETGETGKASTPQSTAIKETDQLTLSAATVNQAVNQANFQTNPVQSYVASQPYYNPYTGLVPRVNDMSHRLFTAWSVWSACSKTCGVGLRARRRSCINPRLFPTGGLCNGLSIQHQSCFNRVCPAYTPQMLPNLSRQQLQARLFAYNPAARYPGFHFPRIPSLHGGTETALTRALTVDGGYSNWSEWGVCDRSCGGGAQVRTRICDKPFPSGSGKMCHSLGPAIQVRRCNRHGCPVDGEYSPWSGFGPCSKSCGSGGFQRRFRTCSNPAPMNSGKLCYGHPVQTRACSTRRCPVDGGYGMWSPWLPCDADCGGGVQERSRFCDNPVPQIGGKDCTILGSGKQSRLCNLFACNVNFQ
ncbi:Hemicentin-1 [Desmophyllum pertusum]|uniref:Hemicentin-1 n=1 Tax=Desmophyllum pertusum TaxID=174260 RepID=A0A9W9YEH5_9CNID|nr:Hemicentin-1 [Desmophyllum pertusum]